MSEFLQNGPELKNQFEQDELLQLFLAWKFQDKYPEIEEDLKRFGQRVVEDIYQMAIDVESTPPVLKQFSPWGERVDEIEVSESWSKLDQVSSEEGIIAHGYKREFAALSRVFQFAKLYLFHPSSAFYSCPLAMTDGAAKLIEIHGDEYLKNKAFKNITSMDPDKFWTSGQWMTEKTGGSDVSQTETIARFEDGQWKLYGTKWFTSATTSQMSMALARIEKNGQIIAGSKGLSLFYIELRDAQGKLQNIEILRLKDKLGTKGLPTAELKLVGTPAMLVGEEGKGVKTISSLFNVTRIYNACTTIASLRRLLNLAKDYSEKRVAFGKPLKEHILHLDTLAKIETDMWGMFMLTFFVAELLGQEECQESNQEENSKVLRLLTPIAKLYTAKLNMKHTSELIESFGGAGYIEDTGLPKFLRDSQVFSIWEGTTNVLSLDALRAIAREGAITPFIKIMSTKLESLSSSGAPVKKVSSALEELQVFFKETSPEKLEHHARNLAFSMGHISAAVLLLEFSESIENPRLSTISKRFCERSLFHIEKEEVKRYQENQQILS